MAIRASGLAGRFMRMGDDRGEPDVIYEIGGRTVGVEVSAAYYGDSDAKQMWTLVRGDRQFPAAGYEDRWGGEIREPEGLVAARVQAEILDKCGKRYSGTDDAWLCVREEAQVSGRESFEACVAGLSIPAGHGFSRIYVIHRSPEEEGGGHLIHRLL